MVIGLIFISRNCNNDSNSRKSDDILKRIEEIHRRNGTTQSKQRKTIYTSFNQSSFIELQNKVYSRIKTNTFEQVNRYSSSGPCVYSRFMKHPPGNIKLIENQTNSNMLLFVWSGQNLNSYHLKQKSSTEFIAIENAQMFIYSGDKWQTETCIETTLDALTPISISGRFENTSKEELDFLRKRFTLTDVESKDFTVTQKNSIFELSQGGNPVKYAY